MHFISEYTDRFYPAGPKLVEPSNYQKFPGIVLPKAKKTKLMTSVFKEQAWHFLLLNSACLEHWRLRHKDERQMHLQCPPFKDWLLPILTTVSEETGEKPDSMVWDLAIGLATTTDFYTSCWAYGRHFRVARQDLTKKTTFDCGISQWFNIDGNKKNTSVMLRKLFAWTLIALIQCS